MGSNEEQYSGKRHRLLRNLAIGAASSIGLSGSASAVVGHDEKPDDTDVEPLSVDFETARENIEEVMSSRLFDSLEADGYLSEPSVEAIPFKTLADESKSGGIERIRVNGEFEQYNYHIPIDGDRLEIMLPLSDFTPTAYLHQENGPEIIYAPDNYYQGEEFQEATLSADRSECGPPYYRSCTSCVACCGPLGWSRNEETVECPNCIVNGC
ncbi:hypothetical protein [Natrinema versiforme]|uniref:Uncharacterized protein n=1 Tax=Natrinema versiforme TaxID=88724 RepID=A0A4P8WKF1_9EURY|nr:hypothetical protein [Natrinema versiforme]QCS44008.1 hypothetical protein FEJ81_17275 [Natrinema versiforme]